MQHITLFKKLTQTRTIRSKIWYNDLQLDTAGRPKNLSSILTSVTWQRDTASISCLCYFSNSGTVIWNCKATHKQSTSNYNLCQRSEHNEKYIGTLTWRAPALVGPDWPNLQKLTTEKADVTWQSDTELKNTDPDYSGHMICGNIPATVEAGTVWESITGSTKQDLAYQGQKVDHKHVWFPRDGTK